MVKIYSKEKKEMKEIYIDNKTNEIIKDKVDQFTVIHTETRLDGLIPVEKKIWIEIKK